MHFWQGHCGGPEPLGRRPHAPGPFRLDARGSEPGFAAKTDLAGRAAA
jgi:hypothetical protein